MEEMAIKNIKKHWYSNFPKWLKAVLLIISIITLIYWVGVIIFKILSGIRVIGAFLFEQRNYWTFLMCILILIVGSLLIAQFALDMNPFGKFYEWILSKIQEVRSSIGNTIGGGS